MKSGNLNFLEPCGPLQACNGTALALITEHKGGCLTLKFVEVFDTVLSHFNP